MSILQQVKSGKVREAIRVIIYGQAGVGKTTIADSVESPLVVQLEDGAYSLNSPKTPLLTDYDQFIGLMNEISQAQDLPFKTLFIDSLTSLENMINKKVISEENVDSIEDIPYGKGFTKVGEKFDDVLKILDWMRFNKGLDIIMTGHSVVKQFKDPAGEAFDQYVVDANQKHVAPRMIRWADAVLFAEFDKSTKEVGEGFSKRTIAKSWGRRIVRTENRATHQAKNRFSLPDTMDLDWTQIIGAINNFYQQ